MFRGKNQGFTLQEKRPASVHKKVRNTVISVIALLVLFLGAGVGYSYYMSKQPLPEVAAAVTTVQAAPRQAMQPVKRDPNAPVGASVQSVTSPITPGSNVSLIVRTTPDATCKIVVKYNEVPAKDSGLVDKVADEYGIATWTWTVGKAVPLGIWPATVTCDLNGKSGVVEAKIVVKDKLTSQEMIISN